jgi:tRNA pseudouridine13 synthase
VYADGDGSDACLAAAIEAMPRWMLAERSLLRGLQKCGGARSNDFVGALAALPRTLRSMYVHAFQSYLWNAAASRRAELYGLELAAEGDLVLAAEDGGGKPPLTGIPEVRLVTAEEAAAGSVPASRVVLPLAGAATRLPANEVAQVYKALAAEAGVELDVSKPAPHAVREYSVHGNPGAYRKLLVRPADFSFEIVGYDDPKADITPTNFDTLGQSLDAGGEGARTQEQGRQGGGADGGAGQTQQPSLALDGVNQENTAEEGQKREDEEEEPGGDNGQQRQTSGAASAEGSRYQALRVSFTLPPSCYATMCLRELLKIDTSVKNMKSMNHAP